MAKFKKNFWNGKGQEPEWYNKHKDGLTHNMGHFKDDPLYIPCQKMTGYTLNGKHICFNEAYMKYSDYEKSKNREPFSKIVFKTSIRNGSSFQTHSGVIKKK